MKRKIAVTLIGYLSLCTARALCLAPSDLSDRFYQAIRSDDPEALRSLARPETVNIADSRGATPLMYAAVVGSLEAMKLLLAAGADPNARNAFGVTPLIRAGGDGARVRILLARGANVTAVSSSGRTPLMTAASRDGGAEIVKLLAARGAGVSATDAEGLTPLQIAAGANDIDSVRFLLDRGVNPNTRDSVGYTPLFLAAMNGNAGMTRLLLKHGLDPNAVSERVLLTVKHGPFSIGLVRPLHEAAAFGGFESVRLLSGFGAKADARELRGMTPLTSAVSTDRPDLNVIRLLLREGADPGVQSIEGESAIDWARKFRNPKVLALLGVDDEGLIAEEPLRPPSGDVRSAVERSISSLQRTGASFLREGGCVSCHAQNLTGMAVRAARDRGLRVDEALDAEMAKAVIALRGPEEERMLQSVDPRGGQDMVMYALFQMNARGIPPSRFSDAAVHYLAAVQRRDGRWAETGDPRPPLEDGNFSSTAMGLRSLQFYGIPARKTEFDQAVQRGASWLKRASARSTSDRVFQLLGIKWALGTAPPDKVTELLALQRGNGGWAQTVYLPSDAFATGQVLYH
jgi:ankyrin repeat protein